MKKIYFNQIGILNIPLLIIIASTIVLTSIILTSNQTSKNHPLKNKTITPNNISASKNISNIATNSAELQKQKLTKYLTVEAAILGVSDKISLFFKDLTNNNEISIDPTKAWIPASTIKSYVVLEAFRQRRVGLIDFNQTVTIKPENVVPTELETDNFPRLREGTTATIQQLVEAMIIQSDNTAYNTLLDILDRRNINLELQNIGITQTVVGEKLNLDSDQLALDLQVPGRQSNTTTVDDLKTFFDSLYSNKNPDSEEILSIFKRQKINNMIPAQLPNGTAVAHKTGDWGSIYHDGGIVYKENSPFILTIFTNSGDPSIISNLAKVAYFQDASSVSNSQEITNTPPPTSYLPQRPIISLDTSGNNNSYILGEKTDEKFPLITASDLGITSKDLNLNPQDANKLKSAIVIPGSFIYNIKRFVEDHTADLALDNEQKSKNHLNLAKARLGEVKTLLNQNNVDQINSLLNESEKQLEIATSLAKNDPNKDLLLTQIKETTDLHFSTLGQKAETIPPDKKEQFIDSVYQLYTQNHQNIAPVVNSSTVSNPIQQKPAIGTITSISNNNATIKFDDGTTKDILLPDDTKVRSFNQSNYQGISSISSGDKVAIVGITNQALKIIPDFILKDIPPELPTNYKGTVVEIQPDKNTLVISDQKGNTQTVQITNQTTVKASNTNVSLEGIKAGSQVTVFGTTSINTSQPSPTPIPSNSNNIEIIYSPKASSSIPNPSNSSKPSTLNQSSFPIPNPSNSASNKTQLTPNSTYKPVTSIQKSISTPIPLQATSITVTNNSSGKKEVIQKMPQKTSPNPPSSNSAPKPNPAPPPGPPPPQSTNTSSSSKKSTK